MDKTRIKLKSIAKIMIGTVLFFAINPHCNSAKKQSSKKPNIILIMADDLGWGDTGYNGNKIIKTPYLDEMAKEGVRFNRFYSASAVCSPTRASVLTGRNPYRTGVFYANIGILRPEEVTIPELLKKEGYTTGHFGKWHLGTLTTKERDANRGKPGSIKEYNPPIKHGYDVAFVSESKVPTYDPMKKPLQRYNKKGWDYLKEGEEFKDYGTHYWDINGNKVVDNLEGDDSRVIMDRVIPFIGKANSKEQPFLAVIWFHTPHMPCVAGPKYQEMYKNNGVLMRNYAGCITAMDEQVGRLRAYLEKVGADSNTMIWFCSDNGPESGNPGTAGGFRDRKRSLHEGGIRVPGIMVWPEKVKKGFQTDIPCVTSDYLPTIMDVLNIKEKSAPNKLDGISLLPLLEGKMKERSKPIGFCIKNQMSLSDNRYKLYVKDGQFELYDIVSDPYEEKNIKKEEFSDESNLLKKGLMKFIESCKSSFEGEEYGKASFDKLNQKWPDPLKHANKKK
ncbi:sulfatase family protein [Saccharicrinis fermentans]|uniref:Arylsulfatase n=1 Tax=Saccharicrinis fermentans DSM 9555 = JCM 21142 TaxID=869213 RepID=W7Y0J1_9BACT|nr:sulfatase-like hydrolase/transferase [Saccharicrinis fermentans]GAF04435.1 arylsulfatase [Saccharicrinis fermentans DSM 9555 = JCM 21142]